MADRKSWREIDRGRDQSSHRRDNHSGPKARVDTATASYKRKLDAFFDQGVVPAHLKDKLPASESDGPSERQKLLRTIRSSKGGKALEKALDGLRNEYGLPDDMDIVLRALEHSKDPVLLDAIEKIEAHLETGMPLPRKTLFIERLKGLEFTSFDPRVQSRALRLVSRLR